MRLHHLRLQAFGPFAGVEQIDFDALSADGLHLIHGATGAGKTSILDAICFALFAGVPGGRAAGRDSLHSDHADPGLRPEVELDFGVSDRRLRVRRSPEHLVPKKRGTGTRSQRGSVQLEELRGGRWATVTTRSDEAAQLIGDLLGMGLSQFAQVMLLPQGDFTAFLRAKADDRGKLLERLFDISDFAAIEQWLVEHRKSLDSQVSRADADRAALIARAQDTLSAIPAGKAQHDPQLPVDSASALRTVCNGLSERLTVALADADAADGHAELTRARLADERALAGMQHQAATAQQTLDRLDEQQPAITRATQTLEVATRADACRPAMAALSRRRETQREARRAADDARLELAAGTAWTVPAAPGTAALSDQALLPLHERAAAGSSALAGLPELTRQVHALQAELRRAVAARAAAGERTDNSRALVGARSAQLAEIEERRAAHLPAATAHPQWRDLLGSIESACRAADATANALHQVTETGRSHRAARRSWVRTEGDLLQLRRERLAGIAAELACDLSDGQPCPVCGSLEHPQAAQPAPGQVDAARIDAAEETLRTASELMQRNAAQWSSAVGRAQTTCRALLDALDHLDPGAGADVDVAEDVVAVRDTLTATIGPHRAAVAALATSLDPGSAGVDETGPDSIEGVVDVLRSAYESVARRTARAQHAARQLGALDRQLETTRTEQITAQEDAAAAGAALRSAAAREDELRDQLTAAQRRAGQLAHEHHSSCGCSTESDVATAHARCVARLDLFATAAQAARTADAELAAARDELERLLVAHDLPDAEFAWQAMLSEQEQARLRTTVATASAERLKATGVLEQPEVAAAAHAPRAEVERCASESASAELAARHTHDAVGDLRRALQTLERITTQLVAHDAQTEPLREQLAVASSLASAVSGSGDNELRMRLTAYVLAARLETVTALANERLAVMTGGRYQLEHTDAKAGRGRSGLGLRVRDAWTGTARDTGTLSGGESFIASLALALGLGDAVLQAAGGRRLETLLVDEGFGSLDEDSLEQVLDVLDALRAGGRSVGIVSHVAELRGRIPSQIRVHKTSTGSTLEVVAPEVA